MRILFSIITCALLACCAIQSPQAGPVGFRLSSGFKPSQIPGLQLWLDASQITGLSDNDPVAAWDDLSGNANNATQGTAAARPLYKVNIKNGKPALLFDGVDDGFALTTGLNLSAYTVFVVWAQTDAVNGSISFIKSGDPYNYHFLAPTSVHHQPGSGPTMTTYATATAAGDWAMTEAYRSGTTLYIGKNGTFDAGQASSINWATDAIGAPYNGGAQYNMVGYIAEMLIYNAGLSTGDRQLVETYLTAKYGLAFTPASIPGLKLWLDASQITGLNDGDAVATWSDRSGNANNVTQGTASQRPTYQTNEINGKPCVRFDGVDDFLRCTTFSQSQPLTVLCVSKYTETADTGRRMFDGATSRLLIGHQGGANLLFFAGAFGGQYTGYTVPWPWRYYTGVFNAASSQQFVNGASIGTGNPGASALTDLRVGCGYFLGAETEFWLGDIAELIIYDSSLSAGNLALLHAYIASKYGL